MAARVSVVIAAFNAGPIIARAIRSVQAQTLGDWETIVVDDASTDDTAGVVADLAREDDRIRLFRHERNSGPAAARNTALDAAGGEWVAILDADDAWRPERLAALIAVAEETGVEFVADNQILFDEAARREVGVALALKQERTDITLERLLASHYEDSPLRFGVLKPLMLRSFIADHNLRYAPRLRYAEDLHFYAELLVHGIRAVLLSDAYYIYTSPIGKLSGQRSPFSRTQRVVESRLWIADDLLAKYRARLTSGEIAEIKAFKARAEDRLLVDRMTSFRQAGRYRDLTMLAIAHPITTLRYVATSRSFRALIGRTAS